MNFLNSQNQPRAVISLAFAGSSLLLLLSVLLMGSCPPAQAARGLDTGCQPVLPTPELHGSAEDATVAATAEAADLDLPLGERTLLLTLNAADTGPSTTMTIDLQKFPGWLESYSVMGWDGERVSAASVRDSIVARELKIPLLRSSRVLSVETNKKNVMHAKTDQVAEAGYALDVDTLAEAIADAFEDNESKLTIGVTYEKPTVTMEMPDGSAKTLELLATSYSDFADSTPGRTHNVYKVFNEYLNNIVLPAGETYSHVAAIDAPVTLKKGWKEDIGLFGGGAALTPGAGICQSSTTLYRAVLLAGLPIVEFKSHSLFVDHYEFYGVGLDATVFPGVHDFRFKNDTGEDLIIQTTIDEPTVIMNVFGKSDGRTVSLDGPYFAGSKHRPDTLRALNRHQIGWVRNIEYADGKIKSDQRISTYAKPLWNSLIRKYDGADGMQLLVTR